MSCKRASKAILTSSELDRRGADTSSRSRRMRGPSSSLTNASGQNTLDVSTSWTCSGRCWSRTKNLGRSTTCYETADMCGLSRLQLWSNRHIRSSNLEHLVFSNQTRRDSFSEWKILKPEILDSDGREFKHQNRLLLKWTAPNRSHAGPEIPHLFDIVQLPTMKHSKHLEFSCWSLIFGLAQGSLIEDEHRE